jgi:hypothetical protein
MLFGTARVLLPPGRLAGGQGPESFTRVTGWPAELQHNALTRSARRAHPPGRGEPALPAFRLPARFVCTVTAS